MQRVPILADASINTFRQAYNLSKPVLLPRQALSSLPAVQKWFRTSHDGRRELNLSYLSKHGALRVPLEFSYGQTFARMQQSLSLSYFLEWLNASTSRKCNRPSRYFRARVSGAKAIRRVEVDNSFFNKQTPTTSTTQIYLAQAPIADLPRALQADLPVPELVRKAGKGDIYDSSIWIGLSPTYTPLHKDPNPNLFVQLAGSKIVRLFRPDIGRGIFAEVQETIGGNASEAMRGEEMMQGAERAALEKAIWNDISDAHEHAYEAELQSGDALYIPKGWWHSVRSSGSGINGSVNWWFR